MQHPQHEQPELAAKKDRSERSTFRLGPIHHQHDASAKQHRENTHELLVKEKMRYEPGAEVIDFGTAHHQRILIGRKRHRKRINIHHQNTQHGYTAQRIET